MSDQLHRFVFEDSAVRGESVRLAATWQAVAARHEYPPPLRRLLGELMAAGALLAATLKFEGVLSLQLQGSGPVKLIVVECTRDHGLRATAKWQGEIAGDGLRSLLGEGRFVVNLLPADGQPGYQGVVGLEGDSVAAALEHYMAASEQIPTRLWLACDERNAAGLLIQKLPEREESDADAWPRAGLLAATVSPAELLGLDAPALLRRLFSGENLRLFDPRPVCFRCTCSRERVAGMLRMLGRDEVRGLIAERGEVEVHCEFCNHRYAFDAVDSAQLFAGSGSPAPGPTRH